MAAQHGDLKHQRQRSARWENDGYRDPQRYRRDTRQPCGLGLDIDDLPPA